MATSCRSQRQRDFESVTLVLGVTGEAKKEKQAKVSARPEPVDPGG